MEGLIQLLHSVTDKPVAVGFGVSGPEQVRRGFFISQASHCMTAQYVNRASRMHVILESQGPRRGDIPAATCCSVCVARLESVLRQQMC